MDNSRINKISSVFDNMFDRRIEYAVLCYIMETGYNNIIEITDDEIDKIEGCAFVTANFNQAIVRTARAICNEFEINDIMAYIRCEANFTPNVSDLTLYRDEFNDCAWEDMCLSLNKDDDTEVITLKVIND